MKNNNNKAFTIIEVVTVLAIAGLIFAVVFAAYPRVQKARRDGQRKNDLAALSGELEFYQSSNRGRYPDSTELAGFISSLSIDFEDPQTRAGYSVSYYGTALPSSVDPGDVFYRDGYECDSDNTDISNSGFNRTYAAVMKLEEGWHCVDAE